MSPEARDRDRDRDRQVASILVVDDQPATLQAMEALLADLAEVVLAGSGPQALRCCLESDFAVILLDVRMPGMDGFETAELIRSREASKATPIIFLTADNQSAAQSMRGYEAGAVDYLVKPVVPEVLRSKVAGRSRSSPISSISK